MAVEDPRVTNPQRFFEDLRKSVAAAGLPTESHQFGIIPARRDLDPQKELKARTGMVEIKGQTYEATVYEIKGKLIPIEALGIDTAVAVYIAMKPYQKKIEREDVYVEPEDEDETDTLDLEFAFDVHPLYSLDMQDGRVALVDRTRARVEGSKGVYMYNDEAYWELEDNDILIGGDLSVVDWEQQKHSEVIKGPVTEVLVLKRKVDQQKGNADRVRSQAINLLQDDTNRGLDSYVDELIGDIENGMIPMIDLEDLGFTVSD